MLENLVTWNIFTFAVYVALKLFKAPCKGTQNYWPTTPNIVKSCCNLAQHCWMLHQCCVRLPTLLHVVAKFETGQTFSYEQTNSTTPNIVRQKC